MNLFLYNKTMVVYSINVLNETTNGTMTHTVSNKCTVGELLDNILEINRCWQKVMIEDDECILNYEDNDIILVDIGLGSEWNNIVIKNKKLTEDENRIIEEYSKDALESYKIEMSMEDDDVEYKEFSNYYYGYYENRYDFVDSLLECDEVYNNPDTPWYIKECIDREKDYLYDTFMIDFTEHSGHYFRG